MNTQEQTIQQWNQDQKPQANEVFVGGVRYVRSEELERIKIRCATGEALTTGQARWLVQQYLQLQLDLTALESAHEHLRSLYAEEAAGHTSVLAALSELEQLRAVVQSALTQLEETGCCPICEAEWRLDSGLTHVDGCPLAPFDKQEGEQ